MALTLKRIGLVLVVLIAILVPALPRPRAPEPDRRDEDRYLQLRGEYDFAGHLWGALEVRDSALVVASTLARHGQPPIVLRGYDRPVDSGPAEQQVTDYWKAIGAADSTVRTAIVLYNPGRYENRLRRWWSFAGATITRDSNGVRCVALIATTPRADGTLTIDRWSVGPGLGPCALLAAFGPPGPAVRGWIEANRYATAQSVAWLNRPKWFVDGNQMPPWEHDWGGWSVDEFSGGSLLLSSSIARLTASLLSPPYSQGVYGLRCLSGMREACRANALDTLWIASSITKAPRDLTYRPALRESRRAVSLNGPRAPAGWWLSDLIRDQGREKFARFWKSDGSMERAFAEAFGTDIGSWTEQWTDVQWDNSWWEKYRHQPRLLGVTLGGSWPLLVAGWSGLALLGAAWVARRRQVT